MTINDNDYNTARSIFVQAGSHSANVAHVKHTQGAGSPLYQGQELLKEARNEFRQTDIGQPNLRSGMTQAHYDAIHKAVAAMGIERW